uniref:Heterocyst differentiation control protein n=1 Tax=Microviridae sp. ctC1P1 TaxID=2824988 RepID=A0A8S5V640_9VIRU|nr:MAG TPA: Heterocyst differentiation control protein [Microviridae sp. ctC1P1]
MFPYCFILYLRNRSKYHRSGGTPFITHIH